MSNLTSIHGGNLTLIEHPTLCTLATCDLTLASFTYIPCLPFNSTYLAIFALLFLLQFSLGIWYKTWGFMVAMMVGLLLEVFGYAHRVLLWKNPFNYNAFLTELICLTIGPAFLTAAIYLSLSRLITVYSPSLSPLKPRTYTLIFCGCDFFSLCLQGLGGGIAATAHNGSGTQKIGKDIMIAGLVFQVCSLLLFIGLCADLFVKVKKSTSKWEVKHLNLVHSKTFKTFLFALTLATLTILTRSLFRVAELSGGFSGPLANNEKSFMILEGGMVLIACLALTIMHPGIAFKGAWHEADFEFGLKWWGKTGEVKGKGKESSGSGSEDRGDRFWNE